MNESKALGSFLCHQGPDAPRNRTAQSFLQGLRAPGILRKALIEAEGYYSYPNPAWKKSDFMK